MLAMSLSLSAGCGDKTGAGAATSIIDESALSYGGVELGDTEREVIRRFGPSRDKPGFFLPAGADGAEVGAANQMEYRRPGLPKELRYRDVAFSIETLAPGRRGVSAMIVTARDARTLKGVGIGQPLSRARRAYRGLRCGTAGTSEFGKYPYCAGKMAPDRWIWFGRDPIKSITVSSLPIRS